MHVHIFHHLLVWKVWLSKFLSYLKKFNQTKKIIIQLLILGKQFQYYFYKGESISFDEFIQYLQ